MRKALIWNSTTADLRILIQDVPSEVTEREVVGILTLLGLVKWEEWRVLKVNTAEQLTRIELKILRSQQTRRVRWSELTIDASTVIVL